MTTEQIDNLATVTARQIALDATVRLISSGQVSATHVEEVVVIADTLYDFLTKA